MEFGIARPTQQAPSEGGIHDILTTDLLSVPVAKYLQGGSATPRVVDIDRANASNSNE